MLIPRRFTAFVVLLMVTYAWSSTVGQTRKASFDPDGSFWIHGEIPNGFSDFGGINLNAKHLRRLPAPGVQLIKGTTFRYRTLLLKREKFTFTTVEIRSVSYSFSGRFLKGGIFQSSGLDDETPVLEGILTKYKAGKKIAEAKMSFVYFGGT